MSAANPKTSALLNTTGDKRGNMFCCYYLEEPNPLKHVPVFLSQNWCLRSIQLRQKTKQVKASTAYSSSQIFPHAVWFLHLSLSLCFFFFFSIRSPVWRRRLQEAADLWTHQLGNLQLHMCCGLLRWQVWRYCTPGPGWLLAAGSWAGRKQTGVFKEELCYPTGIWSSALEEAAVMMDYCNYQNWHGLAQFTTGTSRLMLWIIVL